MCIIHLFLGWMSAVGRAELPGPLATIVDRHHHGCHADDDERKRDADDLMPAVSGTV